MAEQLSTPTIYIQLGTPAIHLYSDDKVLGTPLIRLVEVSGNILESCKVTSPHGREDECAKFTISDIDDAYGLKEIMTIGTEYTLSFWLKASVSGCVRTTGEGTFKATSEWQKCEVTFNADSEDLVLSFDTAGTYYIYHIQLELGNIATDYRPATEDVDEDIAAAQKSADEANAKAKANAEAMALAVKDFQEQLDAQVTIWYGEVAPTVDNYPASDWETNEDRGLHKGDMYYDTVTGYGYRWNLGDGVYSWSRIEDQDVIKALADAATAQDTADKKRRVFVSQPVPPYDEGDLWLKDEELYVCQTAKTDVGEYAESDFKVAVKYTDNTELITFINGDYEKALKSINSQMDKKAETWYQSVDPSTAWTTDEEKAAHAGDLWYDTENRKSYMYVFAQFADTDPVDTEPADGQLAAPYITITQYGWQESDGVPDEVYDRIDGKVQFFATQPETPYYVNDLWVQGEDGDIYICIADSYDEFSMDHWIKASKYTNDEALADFLESRYLDDLAAIGEQIDGKTETWYQTTDPALEWTGEAALHVGDLWLNPDTNESYIFTASGTVAEPTETADGKLGTPGIALYSWKPTFEIPQEVFDTIDGKAQVFTEKPEKGYFKGDLYVEGPDTETDDDGNYVSGGNIYRCIHSYVEGTASFENDWELAADYGTRTYINAEIKKTNDEINLRVKKTDEDGCYVINEINLDETGALIQAEHINLIGAVTFETLGDDLGNSFITEDDKTYIDGGNIKTGTITALGEVTAGSFSLGNGNFIVDDDGYLTAVGATITGTVHATGGEFKGEVTASKLTIEDGATISGLLVTKDMIDAKAVDAEKIDVENLFAQDIEATGTISGLNLEGGTITGAEFVSVGTPPTDVLGSDLSLFIAESTLTANSSVISMEGSNGIESLYTAFGAKIYATDIDYATLMDAALYTTPFGIKYRVRESGDSELSDYFEVDYTGAYWRNSKLVTKSDLSTASVGSAVSASQDSDGNSIKLTYATKSEVEENYLNKTDGAAARQNIGIDIGYVERANVTDSSGTVGVAAGGYTDVAITFNKAFTEVPYVYTTLISTSTYSDIGSMEAVPMSRSTTGATIRIYNDSDGRREPGVQWLAIGN